MPPWQASCTIAAQKYVDDALLNGTGLHHDTRGDYNQVVLLPDAYDTRPFRLPWLSGTVIYLLASAEAHEHSKQLLKVRCSCFECACKCEAYPRCAHQHCWQSCCHVAAASAVHAQADACVLAAQRTACRIACSIGAPSCNIAITECRRATWTRMCREAAFCGASMPPRPIQTHSKTLC